jgi:hypothetical protein
LQDLLARGIVAGYRPQWDGYDRSHKYRPLIDRVEMSRFAGLSSSALVIAVDAVGILTSFTDGL